ncbi:translation initiation factor IF-2-like [Ursus arctos]|uniref:translation initiation factor IF-2-like n=1 Tax=Ursus arctos TaxID=9644 RepID=UPI00254686FA|nr:translation initiation factor IF-2-like [Ursus arctos]
MAPEDKSHCFSAWPENVTAFPTKKTNPQQQLIQLFSITTSWAGNIFSPGVAHSGGEKAQTQRVDPQLKIRTLGCGETRPRAAPSAAAEQRSRAQLHARDAPSGPGPPSPLPPPPGHAAPEPHSPGRPIVLPTLSFPEATPCPSLEPGGQETAVGQRKGGVVGENEEDLDSTLSTGTRRMGKSKSNLVYKPSLPPAPEATAESRPPRATSSVRGFSPPRRSARRRAPQPPLTRAPRPAAGPRGRRAQRREAPTPPPLAGRGRCKRAGERGESARATSRGPAPPPGRPRVPGRGPTAKLRGSRGGCSTEAAGRTLSRGCRPFARPALPHRLHAPRWAPVRARLQSAGLLRRARLRREACGHSPLPGKRRGWPRGGGGDLAAWDSPLRARAGPGATASEPTHLRAPGAGCTAPPGERERQPAHPRASLDGARNGREERKGRCPRPAPTESTALYLFYS